MREIAGCLAYIEVLPQVLLDLGVNIAQGRRQRLVLWYGKTQTHGLIGAVVWILAYDHHPHLFDRHQIHGGKHLRPRRINTLACALFDQQKFTQRLHVGLIELISHQAPPGRL